MPVAEWAVTSSTAPAALTKAQSAPGASDILWEISNTTAGFDELGYVLTKPETGLTRDGSWVPAIVGNGYDSKGGKAQLFIINALTGALIKKIDTGIAGTGTQVAPNKNGLGGVGVVRDMQQRIVAVYGGDLRGNLWKFDLSSTNQTDWKVAFDGKPLVVARDEDTRPGEPIFREAQLSCLPSGGVMDAVWTAHKIFEQGDCQGYWGSVALSIWTVAVGSGAGPRLRMPLTKLQQLADPAGGHPRPISPEGVDGSTAKLNSTPVDYKTKRGWRLALVIGAGERMVDEPQVRYGNVLMQTVTPASAADPCEAAEMVRRAYMLDPFMSGERPPPFDGDADGNPESNNVDLEGTGPSTTLAQQPGCTGAQCDGGERQARNAPGRATARTQRGVARGSCAEHRADPVKGRKQFSSRSQSIGAALGSSVAEPVTTSAFLWCHRSVDGRLSAGQKQRSTLKHHPSARPNPKVSPFAMPKPNARPALRGARAAAAGDYAGLSVGAISARNVLAGGTGPGGHAEFAHPRGGDRPRDEALGLAGRQRDQLQQRASLMQNLRSQDAATVREVQTAQLEVLQAQTQMARIRGELAELQEQRQRATRGVRPQAQHDTVQHPRMDRKGKSSHAYTGKRWQGIRWPRANGSTPAPTWSLCSVAQAPVQGVPAPRELDRHGPCATGHSDLPGQEAAWQHQVLGVAGGKAERQPAESVSPLVPRNLSVVVRLQPLESLPERYRVLPSAIGRALRRPQDMAMTQPYRRSDRLSTPVEPCLNERSAA
ncbi:hypothetical protein FQA39_LY18994 [Lamprigera yunnana]|nr:hypothetical protein FQA39_LY18994 [Lamprigera yunnana]